MNANDRKTIQRIASALPDIEAISGIAKELRELADNEREKFDNLSEGLQASEGGWAIEEAADQLSAAADAAEEIIRCFEYLADMLVDLGA